MLTSSELSQARSALLEQAWLASQATLHWDSNPGPILHLHLCRRLRPIGGFAALAPSRASSLP